MALNGRYRLGKELRLRKRWEFLAVQGGGTRQRGRYFILIARQREVEGPTRLGITVSRRVGGAVVRNRVKRLVREAFRIHRQDLPPSFDLVVVAKQPAARASLAEIEHDLLGTARELARKLNRPEP